MYAPPTPCRFRARRRHHGVVLVYSLLLLSVLVGFASFAVDYGRAQLVKSELRRTADAAARAAVANVSSGITAAQNAAVSIAALNTADGTSVILDPTADVEFGTWNTSTKTFSPLSGAARANANALRVTARRTAARGNAVPLMFASVLGKSSCDVSATAIAYDNNKITPKMNSSTGTFSGGNLQTWGAITLPGGTYVLNNLNCSAPITFTGPAKLYVVNDCNVNGNGYLGTYQNKPANLLIVAGSNLNLWPAQPFYADIFSPNATIATSPGGTSHFYGQIIVQHFLVYNMNLHHDTSLPSHDPTGGGFSSSSTPASAGVISLVN